jgi:hypothetical protein
MLYTLLKKIRFISAVTVSIIVAPILFAHVSYAAILSVYPASSNVSVGNIISLNINVNSSGTAINTAGATINFPTDLLEVMSVSQSPSIFSLWVQSPTFSNTDGTIIFMGGLPTPGFTGQNGQIISIVFRAKKQGTASIVINNGSVLADDGLGTDVLTAQGSALITIGAGSPAVKPSTIATKGTLPLLPVITSTTDPQQDLWYSNSTASFSWVIPSDVTSIQTLLNKVSNSIPTVTYDSSVSQRTVNNLSDGISYFHLRYMNAAGWGPTATYKVQLDTTPPETFTLNVQTQGIQNIVTLDAVDAMSGIASYSVQIDNEQAIKVENSDLNNNEYILPIQNPGQHNLTVIAYDEAGNHTESDTVFTSSSIADPTMTVSPQEIKKDGTVTMSGQTQYPQVPVTVFVQPEGKQVQTYSTLTAGDGSYSIVSNPLDTAGSVSIWSQLVFSTTTQSGLSNKVTINVSEIPIVQTSKSIIYDLSFVLPAVLLILGLLFVLYFGWHKFFGLKKRLEKETQDTVDDVHKALVMFKEELENQLTKLEDTKNDRELNKKEEKIFRELRTNIDTINEFIEKKIKKIK